MIRDRARGAPPARHRPAGPRAAIAGCLTFVFHSLPSVRHPGSRRVLLAAAASASPSPIERAGPGRTDNVERRCAGLARCGGPLRRALAALAGRFVAGKCWQRLGYARAGDYARERLGLSQRELYDLARVDAALATLPGLEAALVAGALPWTKVRLLARAARPEDEARWIAFARGVSVRELEPQVRAVDADSVEGGGAEADPEEAGARRGVCYEVAPETSARWQLGWRMARRVAGANLDPGSAAELIAAEVLSALPMDPALAHGPEDPPPRGRPGLERRAARWHQRRAARQRPADESLGTLEIPAAERPEFLAGLVEGLDAADARALDARLRRAVALEQRREAALGSLLERVAALHLYLGRGHACLETWASDRLGMSPRKAWALLRIERAGRSCPELRTAYAEGRLSWVQAQALLPVVLMSPSRAADWVAWAGQVTVRRLRDDADRAVLLAERDAEAFARTGGVPEAEAGDRLQTRAKSTSSDRTYPPARLRTARVFFTATADVARLFRAAVCTVQRRLGLRTPGEALDAMLEHCFATWSRFERREHHEVFERDGWRCAVPGCSSYRHLHAHHIRFRSHGGGDEPENLVTLCLWHHQQGVHERRVVRIAGRMPGGVRFELPLAAYGPGDRLLTPRSRGSAGARRAPA